jgi:hypothetical protein
VSLHPVATICEPSDNDRARALVTCIYELRESLSIIIAKSTGANSRRFAEGAIALSERLSAGPELSHLRACLCAIDIADAHRRMRAAAEAVAYTDEVPGHDRAAEIEQVKREDKFHLDALRLAKAEAHRALARAVERYPNAYESEV